MDLQTLRDKALAAQALWDREVKGSTVIDGIAIPHTRSPLCLHASLAAGHVLLGRHPLFLLD